MLLSRVFTQPFLLSRASAGLVGLYNREEPLPAAVASRNMTILSYNRMRPSPRVDKTAVGTFRGIIPEVPSIPDSPELEKRLRASLERAIPRPRFKEAEPGLFVLPVSSRSSYGKKAAKLLRKDGSIPAILFGGDQASELLSVKAGDIVSLLTGRGLMGFDYVLHIDEQRELRVTPHICQLHPTRDTPLCITFFRWSPPVQPPPPLSISQKFDSAYTACRFAHRSGIKGTPRRPGTHKQPLGPTKLVRARRDKQAGITIDLQT